MPDFGGLSQGGNLDAMAPSARLAAVLEKAAGPGRRYAGLDDDQLTGSIGRWAAMESYICSQKLAAVTELVRRRGITALGVPERPPDAAPEVPAGWDQSVTEELALALAMSAQAADKMVDLAVVLATRLTAAAAALEVGEVDYLKAKIMAEVTVPLANEAAWNAEKLALMRAGGSFAGKTPGELRKLIERASIAADPEAAENRRAEAERNARVTSWREPEGTMAIQASGLNPADAMAAEAAVQDRAQEYRQAGMTGGMDKLRSQVVIDKLTGRNPLGDQPAAGAVPKRVHLTAPAWILPLLTILGLADHPGEAAGLGAIDPALVRQLAAVAASTGDQTEWHLTLTGQQGWAAWHGCPPPDPRSNRAKAGNAGTVAITLPGGQDRPFTLYPVATGDCDHRYRCEGHDPSDLLRHLTEIRDGTCTRPGCARPAHRCDYEHAIPFESNGPTCMCNGSACCEHDHQIKQKPTWQVTQTLPGFRTWKTPSGRTYTSQPRQYPT